MGEDVEPHSLGERSALSNCDNIAFLDVFETGRAVDGHVLVALLETTVLAAPVEVIAADDDRSLHLRRDDHSFQNASADRHVTGERTLLVDVASFDGGLRRFEAETDVSHVSKSLLAALAEHALASDKYRILLLVCLFRLLCLAELDRRHPTNTKRERDLFVVSDQFGD